MQRRTFLTVAGTTSVAGLGGCVCSDGASPSSETTTSSTEPLPPSTEDLSFTANVLTQASTESPPLIQISLRNNAEETVELEYGATLLFSDVSGEVEWADAIAIEPEHRGANLSPGPEQDGRCWSVPGDATLETISILNAVILGFKDELTEIVSVYARPATDECYPPGEYRFEDRMSFIQTESEFEIALRISIGADGEIVASGEQPYLTAD